MITPCIYPALAGSEQNRPLWAVDKENTNADTSLVADLITALKPTGISPGDCEELTIPIVDTLSAALVSHDDIWVPVEDLTVDALITMQAREGRAWDKKIGLVRAGGRSPVPSVLRHMPTQSHCVALWGYLAIQDLFDDTRHALSTSPIRRDPKLCEGILREFEAYASPHKDYWLHNIVGLRETPNYPAQPIEGDVRASLLNLVAERISYCLSRYRPVHFLLLEEAPNALICNLIQRAKGHQQ